MPLENNPNTSSLEQQPGTPEWINKWEASISLHKSNLPSIEQVRAMTNAALDAAATQAVESQVADATPNALPSTPEQSPMTPSEHILRHSSKWMRDYELGA